MREESEREGGKGRRKEGWREGRGRNGAMEGREKTEWKQEIKGIEGRILCYCDIHRIHCIYLRSLTISLVFPK